MRIMLLTIGANFIRNNQPEPIRNEQAAVKLALEKINWNQCQNIGLHRENLSTEEKVYIDLRNLYNKL